MVFQNPDNQLISTSVEREIAFGLENLALPYEEMEKRVKWALDFFHLDKYKKHAPHKLSGGEKQRVALASVMSMQPEYLVLDEPTSLLDAEGKKEVMGLVEKFSRERRMTVIHVTQFPEEATMADRVLVMHKARIALDGHPKEVFKKNDKLKEASLQPPLAVRLACGLSQRGIIPSGDYLTMNDVMEKLTLSIKEHKIKPGPTTKQIGLEFSYPQRNPETASARPQKIQFTSEDSSPQILTEDLTFVYNQGLPAERKALNGVSLKIGKGDFVGLVGPTGSGKTTLVQHLNALLFPASGRVIFEDVDLSAASKRKAKTGALRKIRQKVGLVFQFPELQLFEDTVYDDVAFGPKNLGTSEEDIKESVEGSMRKVALDFGEFSSRSPFSLSGGEQRKVAIAGILALNPEVLILDEPTCGLDWKSTEEIKKVLKDLNSTGVTIILISHNMDLIAELAQKIILLGRGKVVSFCSKEDFFSDSERIRSIGLDLPKPVEFVRNLEERGIEVEEQIFTEEELMALFDRRFRSDSP